MFNYLFEICMIYVFIWAMISYNKSVEKEQRIIRRNKNSYKRIKREIIKFANTKPAQLYY
jgi:hypothetical protein|uniref:Uncharacterized protein n=1 Tax=Myoviridae sp. ctkfK18 TaxID=2825165 RepID=A0A8S5VGM5_9CAUD|nr:MAG TPA: hypothetical protein [Myoviridae sp. ctkfK18]